MRTTLDIEDDVLHAARELARRERRTAGQVLSDLARKGLTATAQKPGRRSTVRGGVPVIASRGEIVTIDHIRSLRDQEGV